MSAGKQKILVTGQSGILGSDLVPRLDRMYNVVAVSRNPRPYPKLSTITNHALDITQLDKLLSFLDDKKFDIIINCAAMTDVDRCETDRDAARKINSDAVAILASHCAKMGSLLIHISTDYVFDGKDGPYTEDAKTNPINYYGVTKLRAEEVVQSSGCRYIIIRTSFLYGLGANGGSRVVRWILDSHREKKEIKAAVDQFSNPIYSDNLADAIVELLNSDFRGIINIAGADYMSRYEYIMTAADIFALDKSLIKKVTFDQAGLATPRPLRAGLNIDMMKKVLKTKPQGAMDGLTMLRQAFNKAGNS